MVAHSQSTTIASALDLVLVVLVPFFILHSSFLGLDIFIVQGASSHPGTILLSTHTLSIRAHFLGLRTFVYHFPDSHKVVYYCTIFIPFIRTRN